MKLSDLKSARKEVLAVNGLTENDMAENVKILREWMKKLPHIPSDQLQDEFLELCFLRNKCLMEKTKKKIEEYASFKAAQRYEYLFEGYQSPSEQNIFYVAHPELTEDLYRVHVGSIKDEKEYTHLQEVRNILIMSEVLSHCDYNNGEILICDYSRVSLSIMSKYRINIAADCIKLFLDGYSAKIKEIHIVNKSAKTIFSFFAKMLPEKIVSRLVFHEDFESLRKAVPAKFLPSDFGGEWKNFDECLKDWDKIFEEERDLIQSYINIKGREELKNEDSYTDEMKGTFKKLGID